MFLRGDLSCGYSILKHMPDGTVKQIDVKCPYDTRSAHVTAFNYGWGYNTVMITEGVNVHIGCNPPSYTFNGGVGNIVTADFDGDGRSDLVVDTFDGPVFMRANGAPGFISFAAPVVLDTVNDYHSLATADFNGDGLPDLAVGRYNIAANGGDRLDVYLGDRTNGLGPASTASQWRARELAPVDIDGDGIIDLAAASEAAIVVRLGLGDGTFGAERVLDSASSANFGVATGDRTGTAGRTSWPVPIGPIWSYSSPIPARLPRAPCLRTHVAEDPRLISCSRTCCPTSSAWTARATTARSSCWCRRRWWRRR